MRVLPTKDLSSGHRQGYPLFHEDGTLLLLPYQEVDELLVEALSAAGVERVFVCENRADLDRLRRNAAVREIPVSELEPGSRLDSPIYDDGGRLLLSPGQEVMPAHLAVFNRRGIETVYERTGEYGSKLARFSQVFTKGLANRVDRSVREASRFLRVRPSGEPLSAKWGTPAPSDRTAENLDDAFRFHTEALERTYSLFERLRVEGNVDLAAAHDLALTIIDAIARDRDLSLSLGGLNLHNDYLIDHSVSVCVMAIAIAARLGYGKGELLNLGISALLHDIGMTRVPKQVIEKPGGLTPNERREVERHTAHGMRIVQRSVGAGAHVPFSIYQTHERISGEGYPKRRRGEEIHDFAKIIAVADVYQAMTSPRSYKSPMKPYKAMEQILKMVGAKLLDAEAVRAFLQVHSLFPVGSWVRLNQGHVARVISAVDDNYTRPKVSVVLDAEGEPLASPLFLDLSQCEDIEIAEALMGEEVPVDHRAGLSAEGVDVGPRTRPSITRPEDEDHTRRRKVPMDFMDWSASFAGSLSDFRVLDIIQLLDLSQKSGLLRISAESGDGLVYFREGEMLHAEFAGQVDEEAVFRMVELDEGSFSFAQRHVERAKTIGASNTSILMEGCRRMDEREE